MLRRSVSWLAEVVPVSLRVVRMLVRVSPARLEESQL